jgi:hypothetical protein
VFFRRGAGTISDDSRPTIEVRVVTEKDLVSGRSPTGRGEVDANTVRTPPIKEGDVLVPAITRRLVARVATAEDIGSYPAAGVLVIRPDPTQLDPRFLAGYLSSTQAARQSERGGSLGGSLRVDVRRIRMPLPPLEIQRRLGAMFEQMSRMRQALRSMQDDGEALRLDVTDALVARVAPPRPGTDDRLEPIPSTVES